jgi:glucose 1-dehydrogenase
VSDLSGKKALVTGAGMGIGQGIAVELARRGAEVAIHYAHTEPEETVSQIEKLGGKATTVHGDLSKVADCERTVDISAEALGGLDTRVNNAGVTKTLDFLDTDEKTYGSVFDLNMKGYSFLARRAVPYMMNLPRLRRCRFRYRTGPLRRRRYHGQDGPMVGSGGWRRVAPGGCA